MRQLLVPGNLIIAFAALVHATWGFSILISPHDYETTGIGLVVSLCHSPILAATLFILASGLAIISLTQILYKIFWNVCLLIPQQFLLFVSAISAGVCISQGRFADGALYPVLFILRDQVWLILLCAFHLISVLTSRLYRCTTFEFYDHTEELTRRN